MSSAAAASAAFVAFSLSSALVFSFAFFSLLVAATPRFLGACCLIPTLTAAPPSSASTTGPGAGRLLRLPAAVTVSAGVDEGGGVVVLLRGWSRVLVGED